MARSGRAAMALGSRGDRGHGSPMAEVATHMIFKAMQKLLMTLDEVQLISLILSPKCQLSGKAIAKAND